MQDEITRVQAPIPDGIKRLIHATFPGYRGRKVRICLTDNPRNVKSYWDSGSRDYFTFVRLDNFAIMPMPAQSAFDRQIPGADRAELPPGCALVEHSIFCGKDIGITIHVRRDNPEAIRKLYGAPLRLTA